MDLRLLPPPDQGSHSVQLETEGDGKTGSDDSTRPPPENFVTRGWVWSESRRLHGENLWERKSTVRPSHGPNSAAADTLIDVRR